MRRGTCVLHSRTQSRKRDHQRRRITRKKIIDFLFGEMEENLETSS